METRLHGGIEPHIQSVGALSTKVETGPEETPSLVLQMVGFRTGVEEDVLLIYHKKRQNSPKYKIVKATACQITAFPISVEYGYK